MNIFDAMERYGHEELVFWYDKASGLKAVVAIHDTTLGPALGGCRMWPYHTEDEVITDALRLSRGMTFKNAAMGLDMGGGKAVIWGNSHTDKSEAMLLSYGRLVQSLGGRYITAEDVGVSADDMGVVARETRYVGGLAETSGDPSPATAYGVLEGMKACLEAATGTADLSGRHVAIQGLGHVGVNLARLLREAGATLTVTDLEVERGRRLAADLGATWVEPDDIYDVECDVFAPCALGAVLNDDTIPRLRCRIVAGSANNQLQEPRHGEELKRRGILYAPDYVINGGGVINVADEFHRDGYHQERAFARIRRIGDQLREIIATAERENIPTSEAADRVALARLELLSRVRRTYIPE
jgi:leucine dehydrogenase